MVKAGDRVKIVKHNDTLEHMGFSLGTEHTVSERKPDGADLGLYVYAHDGAWFALHNGHGMTQWIGYVDLVPEFDAHTRKHGKEKASACECGGHRAGFKDFTRQHYSWCPVYKG